MRRNRPVVVLAALGIIVVSIFGGALSAAADPPTGLVITTPSQDTLATTIAIAGNVTPSGGGWDTLIELWSEAGDLVCSTSIPYTDTAWSCPTVALAEGYNYFYATAYDNDGEPDEFADPSDTITIARGGYEFVTIQVPSFNGSTADPTPLFSGVGPVLGSVQVHGPGATVACTAAVDETGHWSCEATSPIPPDTYTDFWAQSTFIDASPGDDGAFHTFTVLPPKPTMSYAVAPGMVTATGVGVPTSGVSIELRRITEGGTYIHTLVDGCPTLIDTLPFPHVRAYGGSTVTCPLTLDPGIWSFYSQQVVDGVESAFSNDYVRVPTAPTIAAHVNGDRSVTISGSGSAGGIIHVETPSHANVCQTAVSGTSWSCTVTQSAGAHKYLAYAQDQGFVAVPGDGIIPDSTFQGASAYSALVSVTVPTAPAPPAPPALPAPRPWTMSFGDITEVEPGDEIVIEGADAPAGAAVDGEIHSTPAALGSTVVDPDGTFSITASIPEETEPGAHHIVVTVTPADGSAPSTIEQPITVLAPPPPAVVDEPAETQTAGSGAGGASTIRSKPGAVSALTVGFVTPAEIISNPLVAATAGSLGLALVLLVLVPAEFFGESLANHYGSFAAFMERRKRLSRATKAIGSWVGSHRLISGIVLVLLTSAVFSFVDPGFGFDLTSLRLLLSCAVSILLVNFASAGVTELVAERAWKVPTRLKVMPWGLAIAIVGVVASRILNFSPGFLIGSIIGVGIIGHVGAKLEARVILLWSAVVWAIAVVAWALIGLVPVLPASEPVAFWTALLTDSLVATSAAGLTALLVALLPIALFDGGELFAYSKLIWGAAFGIAAATFCLIVVPSASNWMGLGDGLLGWLLLTLSFIALAIVAYVFARRRSASTRSRLLTVD